MLNIPLKVNFANGVQFYFPSHLCCNCGTRNGLKIISQDTRRTTYMFGGGTEITFKLPLPFCDRCAKTATRRPKNIAHRILLLILSFAIWFAILVGLGSLDLVPETLSNYLAYIAIALAVTTTLAVVLMARPADGQSSYFQPVRIPTLKREFVSGIVTAIGFSFTNHEYADHFQLANKDAIARNQVYVIKA